VRLRPAAALTALLTALTVTTLVPAGPAFADAHRDRQWHLGYLKISQAHQLSQGAGVVVAVVDTGSDGSHPDLSGNVLPGTDFAEPGGDGQRDDNSHGTAMAGLIAAHGRGSNGVLGIAPQAKVLPVRITAGTSTTFLAFGIDWAVAHQAKVISIATGDIQEDPMVHSAVEAALAADVVVVASTGNTPKPALQYPSAQPGVVAATAVDRAGGHAEISVSGPAAVLAAPGVDMYSIGPGGRYWLGSGTSPASAIISGVAALIRSRYPDLPAAEVVRRMTATATDKGPPGRDPDFGYGIVDPVAALTADLPPPSPTPAASGSSSGTTSGQTEASDDSGGSTGTGVVVIGGVVLLLLLAAAGVVLIRRRSAP